jgi:hypothetical protein
VPEGYRVETTIGDDAAPSRAASSTRRRRVIVDRVMDGIEAREGRPAGIAQVLNATGAHAR